MKSRAYSKTILSDPLSLLLPTTEETLLLRVCLCPGDLARQAWHEWYDAADAGGQALLKNTSVKRLRPLLFNAIQFHGLDMDKEGLTFLRTAYLKEELRSSAFRRICRQVLLLLRRADIRSIVLKGAALAETVYPNPILRHCHDIDILLPEEEMSRAAGLMEKLGFRASAELKAPLENVRMVHESKLPLEFHSRLFDVPFYDLPLSEVQARSDVRVIADVPARVLGMSENLLHVCGHASYSASRHSLRWVNDAWFIIDRNPSLDWDVFLHCTQRSHLRLPVAVMLRYLAEHLNASIPRAVLDRLSTATSSSTAIERELALRGVRSTHRSLTDLFHRTKNWRERALVIRWLLFPTPSYLSWVDQIEHGWLLPFHYVYRPMLHLARYFRSKLRRATYAAGLLLENALARISFRPRDLFR